MRTPQEVILDVEAELALLGLANPSASLFRGCSVCLLPVSENEPASVPAGSSKLYLSTLQAMQAAAASQQALQACQAKRAALMVRLYSAA